MKIKALIVLVCFFVQSASAAEVARIVAVGMAAKKFQVSQNATIEDGFLVQVLVFNDGKDNITLPSKLLDPEILERDKEILVLFTYRNQTFVSKSERRAIIPSREAFAPVTLRPGECMVLEPAPFILEQKDLKGKPVFFALKTKGFLADRLDFAGLDLRGPLLLPDYSVSPERREP